MDISTKVNIVLSVLSFILAAISIITVVITLRQNNKMIENSTRPHICIYFDYTQCGEPTGYFVVKNFGTSAAYIDSLTYNDVIKNHPKSLVKNSLLHSSCMNTRAELPPLISAIIPGKSIIQNILK